MGRKLGWGDQGIGKKKPRRSSKKQEEIELDLDLDGDDEDDAEPEEEVDLSDLDDDMKDLLGELEGEEIEEPAKPKKKAKKKRGARKPRDEDEEAPAKPRKSAKKKATKKPRRRAKKVEDHSDELLEDADPRTATENAAKAEGVDLNMECPVCRSLEPCDCQEEDRTFQRRTRFEADAKKVARCPRCGAPMSVVYLPRPNTEAPHSLAHFNALYGCSCCAPESLATVLISTKRGRHPSPGQDSEGED